MELLENTEKRIMLCVHAFLFGSLACAVGAIERLPWTNEVQEDAGRALVMGTDWTAPAPAPVRNIQHPHKNTYTLPACTHIQTLVPISSHHGETVP